jgi:hypothetical protein
VNPGHYLIIFGSICIAVCLFAASCVAPETPVRGTGTMNPINPCHAGSR